MTAATLDPEPVPLTRDEAGRLMVPGTRISLAEQEREGAEIQARIEAEYPLDDGLRARLLARLDT